MKITLKPSDLRAIKEAANTEFMARACPNDLEGPEFLVYCFTKAVEHILCSKGLELSVKLELTTPYEVVE